MPRVWENPGVDVPAFRYYPDPVAAGSAVSTDEACGLCGVRRGIRYDGPVYGSQPGVLCRYCIQSGEAARRLGVPAVGLVYGQSVTDACMDFGTTTAVLEALAAAVHLRRRRWGGSL